MNFLKFITKKIYLFIFSFFLSFGFITTSYAIDITIWDLSGRNGQDEFYDNLNKEYKKINSKKNMRNLRNLSWLTRIKNELY